MASGYDGLGAAGTQIDAGHEARDRREAGGSERSRGERDDRSFEWDPSRRGGGVVTAVRLLVVMGVAGCGKSTVAAALAEALGGSFVDGDALHPPENIAKMSRGEALSDADRWPWLERFGAVIAGRGGRVVGACSSLRRAYRDRIRTAAGEPVLFVHLDGSRELIAGRMAARRGHFMPTSLLDSQFAALERLGPDEEAVVADISGDPEAVLAGILASLEGRLAGS